MKQLRCRECGKLLGEVEGNDFKLLLYCRKCKKIWPFQKKNNKKIVTEEKKNKCKSARECQQQCLKHDIVAGFFIRYQTAP